MRTFFLSHLLTFSFLVCQSLLNKVCRLLKVDADVEVVGVTGWYPVVGDACVGVELSVGVHVHEGVSLCCVQDVRDAQALEAHHVCHYKSASGLEKEIFMKSLILCSIHSFSKDHMPKNQQGTIFMTKKGNLCNLLFASSLCSLICCQCDLFPAAFLCLPKSPSFCLTKSKAKYLCLSLLLLF